MKVAYYGEQAPRSLLPLIVVVVLSWVAIAMAVILSCGVV